MKYGLETGELYGAEVLEVVALRARYPGPGANDLFALVLAKVRDATLLTGNSHLTRAAESEGVPVHGTLWVLDRLVERQMISAQRATEALTRMLEADRRLPPAECQQRLRQWER